MFTAKPVLYPLQKQTCFSHFFIANKENSIDEIVSH